MPIDEVKPRLGAILAADVVGYSRLMGDDERATVATLNEFRQVFREHIDANGGRIVDMAGDSVLAVFDSAIGAAKTAVDVQGELANRNEDLAEDRRMLFRVGVNLGDIIEQQDGTIYGDGVNVAARLEAMASPGGISVSGSVYDSVRSKLAVSFDFLGEHQVKNIADPVRTYRVRSDSETLAKPAGFTANQKRLAVAFATMAVVVIAFIAWHELSEQSISGGLEVGEAPPEQSGGYVLPALPTGPAIAVLPFDNPAGDHEQDYFAVGLTEDLITRLSRFSQYLVFARNTTSHFAGGAVDLRNVGQQLGADYVVEGSIRRDLGTVRVNVRVLETESGASLWAETYDRDLSTASLFEIQDTITTQIAAVIGDYAGVVARDNVNAAMAKPTDSLDAYECVLRFVAYMDTLSPEDHRPVRDCLERAVESDPSYAQAWSALGFTYVNEAIWGAEFDPRPDALDRALDAAQTGVRLAPSNGWVRTVIARVHFHRHDVDQFLADAEHAIALNPNNASTLALLGDHLVHMGEFERGYPLTIRAMALNPKHPSWYYFAVTIYFFARGELEQALDAALRIDLPNFWGNYTWLGAIYGHMGRLDEAAAAAEKVLALYPDYVENFWRIGADFNTPIEILDLQAEGLRLGGLDIPEAPVSAE